MGGITLFIGRARELEMVGEGWAWHGDLNMLR